MLLSLLQLPLLLELLLFFVCLDLGIVIIIFRLICDNKNDGFSLIIILQFLFLVLM